MVIRSIDEAMLRARLLLMSLVLSAVPATLFMVGCATAQETMADGRPVPSPAHVAALETARAPATAFAAALAEPALRAQAVLAASLEEFGRVGVVWPSCVPWDDLRALQAASRC